MSTSQVLEKRKKGGISSIKLGYSKTKVQVRAKNDSKGITVSKGPTSASFNKNPGGKSFSYSTTTRKNFSVSASASKRKGGGRSKKLTLGKTTGRNTYKGSVSRDNGKTSGSVSFSRRF